MDRGVNIPSASDKRAESAYDDISMFSKIEPSKIIDLIVAKQTQYYTLWGVYTAVQFAAGGFGSGQTLSDDLVFAVLLGVWAFNFGHLGFVLQCVEQLSNLRITLNHALTDEKKEYQNSLRISLENIQESEYFWRFYGHKRDRSRYIINSLTHFFIDICASLALASHNPWLHAKMLSFLKAMP